MSISLPNQTLWMTVPKGSILHIDELALYHLTDDEYQAEIEISLFFKQHSFVLDPELEERIKEEGTQLIDLLSQRLFRLDKPDQEPEPENLTNLIEIMPMPPRWTPDN